MNNVTTNNNDSGGFSQQELTLVGIIVSVIIQLILCAERAFARVNKSSCRRGADGAIDVTVESKEKA